MTIQAYVRIKKLVQKGITESNSKSVFQRCGARAKV